ncbi:MAG: response regulator transcription factor [Desulfobacula sp.]|nr:response regulator transcription factor [Desulfobacula sp.]
MGNKKMTSKDFQDVLRVSQTALEIEKSEEQLSVVLNLLEQIFKTGNNNFYFANDCNKSLDLNHVISRGIEKNFFTEFKQYYHKLDPFYEILSINSYPTVIIREHSKNRGKFSEYYHDFLKPQHIHHQMSIYLKSKQHFLGVLGLYRPRKANKFSLNDHAKANLLAPYLASALENALSSEQKNKQHAILDSIAAHMPYKGIIALDESMKQIYQNEHAKDLLFNATSPQKEQVPSFRSLHKKLYQSCKEFFRLNRRNKNTYAFQNQCDISCKINHENQKIHLEMIPYGDNHRLILLGFGPRQQDFDSIKLKSQFSLSKRQTEIVYLVNKGLTNKKIGEKLFISRYTVENHLKAIFEKVNVKNRTKLIYRLSSGK